MWGCTENALFVLQINDRLERNHSLDGNRREENDRRVGCVTNHIACGRVVEELQTVRGQHFCTSRETGKRTDQAACRFEFNLAKGSALRLVVQRLEGRARCLEITPPENVLVRQHENASVAAEGE